VFPSIIKQDEEDVNTPAVATISTSTGFDAGELDMEDVKFALTGEDPVEAGLPLVLVAKPPGVPLDATGAAVLLTGGDVPATEP